MRAPTKSRRLIFTEQEQVKLTLLINVINGWNRIAVGFNGYTDPSLPCSTTNLPSDPRQGVAVVGGIVSYASGRGYIRWIGTALGLLAVSGLTRLLEFWIQQGTGGVS